jgi:predicted HicB family RNase H-like nuclease
MSGNSPPTRPARAQINHRIPREHLDQLDRDARARYQSRNDLVVQILSARYRSLPDA